MGTPPMSFISPFASPSAAASSREVLTVNANSDPLSTVLGHSMAHLKSSDVPGDLLSAVDAAASITRARAAFFMVFLLNPRFDPASAAVFASQLGSFIETVGHQDRQLLLDLVRVLLRELRAVRFD